MSPTALKGRSGLLRLSLLSLAIGAGPACAQDSGVGVDLQFGNALNPAGKLDHGCDPDGFSWLAGESKRTPTGFTTCNVCGVCFWSPMCSSSHSG